MSNATVTEEPQDMPKGLQEKVPEVLLPHDWVEVVYGIPETQAGIRDRLRGIIKRAGFRSIDDGGSVYVGLRNDALDTKVLEIIEDLRIKTGSARELIKYLPGTYENEAAAFFKNTIVENALKELDRDTASITELQDALVGNITLVDAKGKERDLLTMGASRITGAKNTLNDTEGVIQRFGENPAFTEDVKRIRLNIDKTRAWVERVEEGYKRWAVLEKERRKAAVKTEGEQ